MTTDQAIAMMFPLLTLVAGGAVALFLRKPWAKRRKVMTDNNYVMDKAGTVIGTGTDPNGFTITNVVVGRGKKASYTFTVASLDEALQTADNIIQGVRQRLPAPSTGPTGPGSRKTTSPAG